MKTKRNSHLCAVLFQVLTVFTCGQICLAGPLFDAPLKFGVENCTWGVASVAFGDLNADSITDMAVACESDGVSILIGMGDGIFMFPYSYDVENYPSSLVIEDFDRDGSNDLAISCFGEGTGGIGGSIAVLLNNGDGTFQDPVTQNAGDGAEAIAAGDLDGDSYPDLVVARSGNDGVAVLENIGGGSFNTPDSYTAGTDPYSVALGDFNGDGDMDIAVANMSSDNVSVLLGYGTGNFHSAVNYTVGNEPLGIKTGDFNGDGDLDLVTVNGSSSNVSVLLGTGTGTFGSAINTSIDSSPLSIITDDFDEDGEIDLAVGYDYYHYISILLGDGDGTFQTPIDYGAGGYIGTIATADVDGDGNQDIAAGPDSFSWDVYVLLGNGAGSFVGVEYVDSTTATEWVVVRDFDRDKNYDLATANGTSDSVSVYLGNGDGTFDSPKTTSVGSYFTYYIAAGYLIGGDLNVDLVTVNYSSDSVSILTGNGNGTFTVSGSYTVGDEPESVDIADLDGDGNRDLVVTNSASDNVSVLLNNGSGTFAAAVNYSVGYPRSVALDDLDGDGDNDMAVANDDTDYVSVLLNNGDGTFGAAVDYGPNRTYGPISVDIDDLDGDGDQDIAVAYWSIVGSDTVAVLLNNGDGTFPSPVSYEVGEYATCHDIHINDLNEDGDPDLVVSDYWNNGVILFWNDGSGGFIRGYEGYATNGSTNNAVVADLDEDGLPDIASASSGSVSLLISLFQPVCNDLDGDGYGDAATRPYCTHTEWDCDDMKSNVNPGMTEITGNGIDDDCDSTTPDIAAWTCYGAGSASVPGSLKGAIAGNILAMVLLPLGFVFCLRMSRKRR